MKPRIRLLWVFSTFALGGPQRRMATLVGSLGDGYEHLVLAMDGRFDAESVLPESIAYQRIEEPVAKGVFVSLANLKMIRRVLREHSPDLLLTSNWGAIEWLLANRGRRATPHVHFEDGFGPDERPDRQSRKRVMMRRLAFRRRALSFVAPSEVLADVFVSTWKVSRDRVHLIPNGVACDHFSAKARKSRPLTIGTVAALRAEKRLDRLIDVFARVAHADTRLLIVGDGPERGALEARAASLGERVVFAGAQDDVAPFLSQMDLYSLTSDTEQMPISLVEAMAASLPVVATDVGDVAAMVAPENHEFIVGVEDDGLLVDAMDHLLSDDALRQRLGYANRQKSVAEYDLATMTARYDALFREMATPQ